MRTVIILMLAATIGCNTAVDETAKSKNEDTAKKLFEHFNAHHWEAMASLYNDSAEFLDPSYGTNAIKVSKAELVQKYQELESIFPNIHDSVIAVIPSANGEVVTVQFVSLGESADGAKLELPICSVLFFENGSIVKDFTYYDN